MKRTPKILAFAAILGVIGAVGWFGWSLYGHRIQERLGRRSFDAAEWQGEKNLTNDIRIRMVDDLLRRHNLRGMTRDQVTAMLGEPDKTEKFKEWDMIYWLGPERGWMSIDSEWLVFRLDSQQKVTDLRVVKD